VKRVVIAVQDPFPKVAGRGISRLRGAGITCDVGIRSSDVDYLLAPYRKLTTLRRPWLIAKWAMTLDGKLATRAGDSRWISSEESRQVVHRLRGRVDGIVVGRGTARADDPLLTARPADIADIKRVATRIVVDSNATLSPNSRLVQTAREIPVIVAAGTSAPPSACGALVDVGVEIVQLPGAQDQRLDALLAELGRRRMTNVLIEGGGQLLGTLFDMRAIDEAHVFIAPKLAGGVDAPAPLGGTGVDRMADAPNLRDISIEELGGDVYVHGRVADREA
jgi:diaminohydroxyphosphoribosylaminopyrimidine deaminase/5-amino-6-(5-phosphoribosylamino)uracil reductase